jgi:toxoflavin synthase
MNNQLAKIMAEYDSIAKDYAKINYDRPLLRYAAYASFFKILGDLKGKSVLDLACGDGFITQKIKQLGAKSVLGIDVSEKMIEIALGVESKDPLDIKYQTGKVGQLGKIGEFDVVTGAFLLHYAKTRGELLGMCSNIAVNLKSGGYFVGLNNNPGFPLNPIEKYQDTISAELPLHEGSKLSVRISLGNNSANFINYFWKKETYEAAFRRAGLEPEWHSVKPTREGIGKMGGKFWQEFLNEPFFVIIKAMRK